MRLTTVLSEPPMLSVPYVRVRPLVIAGRARPGGRHRATAAPGRADRVSDTDEPARGVDRAFAVDLDDACSIACQLWPGGVRPK